MTFKDSNFNHEFREHLLQYFNEQKKGEEEGFTQNHAAKLAHYLVALRHERGWSRTTCAEKANLSEKDLFLLEKGLILSTKIESYMIFNLAAAFDEDIVVFESLLDRNFSLNLNSRMARLYEMINYSYRFFNGYASLFLSLCAVITTWWLWATLNQTSPNLFYPIAYHLPFTITLSYSQLYAYLWTAAVIGFLIGGWLLVWQGERLLFQLKKEQFGSFFVAGLLAYGLFTTLDASFRFDDLGCFTHFLFSNCDGQLIFSELIPIFGLIALFLAMIYLFIDKGHLLLLQISKHRMQKKLVFITLIITLLLPLTMKIFDDFPPPPELSELKTVEITLLPQEYLSLMYPNQLSHIIGLTSKQVGFFKLGDINSPTLHLDFLAILPVSLLSLLQLFHFILYTLMGILIIQKGKFLSAFSP